MALIQADLLSAASLPDLVKTTIKQFGRLDILVNNASSFFATAIGEITDKAVGRSHRHQFEGAAVPVAGGRAVELRKRHGCIVNIVDIHAELPMKNYVVYTVAKGGLLALTRSLARELGPGGARERGRARHHPMAGRRCVVRRAVAPAHHRTRPR